MWSYFYRTIAPTNNPFVSAAAFGEGWHNYHHVFPWDYKTSELGDYSLNMTTGFIDLFAKIGKYPRIYWLDAYRTSCIAFAITEIFFFSSIFVLLKFCFVFLFNTTFQVGHMIWRPYPRKLFENEPNARVMVHDILPNALTNQTLSQLKSKTMIITTIRPAVIIEM